METHSVVNGVILGGGILLLSLGVLNLLTPSNNLEGQSVAYGAGYGMGMVIVMAGGIGLVGLYALRRRNSIAKNIDKPKAQ